MLKFICFLGGHKLLTTLFIFAFMVFVGVQRGTLKFGKED